MKRPSNLEWEATAAAIPVPVAASKSASSLRPGYRRIGPLEAATATAVIITCLVATAVMTGVLPMPASWSTRQQSASAAPVASPASAMSAGAAPSTGAPAGPAPLQADLARARFGLPPGPAAPSLAGGPMAAEGATTTLPTAEAPARTPSPITMVDGAQGPSNASSQTPTERPSRPLRHHRRTNPHHQRAGNEVLHGKTRAQVIEELMQAKRDGSYSAAAELYR